MRARFGLADIGALEPADVGALEPLLTLAQEWVYIMAKTLEISGAIKGLNALPKAGATVDH